MHWHRNSVTPPPAEASEADIARTYAAMAAQAEQQMAKIAALDQQVAQKAAEAESISATVDKLEAGLPFVTESAEVREKAMKMEYGNRVAFQLIGSVAYHFA